MPYLVIEDFRGGLDKRRDAIAAIPGTLQTLKNAHISRGGDIEKRKAFVTHATLPAGTFGFAAANGQLYVFGSGAEPGGMPGSVIYQRLQHPDGLSMTSIVDYSVFSGKLYVVAEYSNGDRMHFYDGTIVGSWYEGVVRSSFTNNNGIASELRDLINAADTEYELGVTATVATNVVTVTSDTNTSFDISSLAENVEGGTDDQTLAVATTQEARADLDEVLATASFQVINGREGGTCRVTNIKVNNVSIITSAIDWTGTNEYTAQLIADEINGTTSTPNYTAEAEGNTVVVSAVAGTGDNPNGFALEVTTGEEFIVNIGSFEITGGTSNPGTNRITNVTIDGSSVLSGNVDWATSNSATAEAIASNIRSASANYTAYADGATVYLSKLTSKSSEPNNFVVVVATGGDTAVGGSTDDYTTSLVTTINDMDGGVDFVAGQPQISTLTVGGTFEVGDRFSVTIDDQDIGGTAIGGERASAVLTHKQKVYAVFGPTLGFSGIGAPTKWGRNSIGAGQIDMSSQAAGSETLTALAVYQSELAVFARRAIQREFVDVDEDQNTHLQTINNFGTIAPKTVASFGESDVFFLSDSGVRSLRARDSSNTASISDIGTPIDPLLIPELNALSASQLAAARGIIEPEDGRYLLSVGGKVYVFSFFPVSKISAWSEYSLGFTVDEWVSADNRLYARSGDTIYIYGGASNTSYDSAAVEVIMPYVDGRRSAHFKSWVGYDIALSGEWIVEGSFNPNKPTSWNKFGTVYQHSYDNYRMGIADRSTHLALRLTHQKAEAAKVINVALEYNQTGVHK